MGHNRITCVVKKNKVVPEKKCGSQRNVDPENLFWESNFVDPENDFLSPEKKLCGPVAASSTNFVAILLT